MRTKHVVVVVVVVSECRKQWKVMAKKSAAVGGWE